MSPTREQQRQETRRKVYSAALAIFRRDGVGAARIDDIAKCAGVSRGTFYFHFPAKEDVLLARMRETEQQICGAIDELPEDTSLRDVLGLLADQLTAIWEREPQLLPDVAAAALRFTAVTMVDRDATRLRSTLAERFCAAVERGEVSATLPSDILGDLYLGNTLAGMLAWYGNPVLPLRTVLEGVTILFWQGAQQRVGDSS